MDDIDIWRTAHVLMKQHGEHAAFVAAERADECLKGFQLGFLLRTCLEAAEDFLKKASQQKRRPWQSPYHGPRALRSCVAT